MSQNDLSIANQGFPAFRSDLNAALQALGSTNSGTSAPSTTYANQLWYDTTNNILYIRNEDNDAWIKLFTLDQTNDNVESLHGDTIAEATSGSGVTIDSVLLKDGELGTTASPVPINSSSLNGSYFGGHRNLVQNPKMQVAQRGTSSTSVTSSEYLVDRFEDVISALGTWTLSQSTTAPDGFTTSHKVECTTANASPVAGAFFLFTHRMEAQNLQHLKYGTSSPETLTISFYVRSNKTGTYNLELIQPDASNRHRCATYTINSADQWEQKVITFTGDTSGVINNDNGEGLQVNWWLGSGSSFSSGTRPTDWSALAQSGRAVDNVNLADTVGNEWYITGVQMEIGSVNTSFEHRSYQEELLLCQRFYCIITDSTINARLYANASSTFKVADYSFPVTMRTTPTASQLTAPTFLNSSTLSVSMNTSSVSFRVVPSGAVAYYVKNYKYDFDSEL